MTETEIKLTNLSPADIQLIEATKPNPQPTCIIPVRGGSKRILNKNKRLLNGRPLFDYALKAAIDSKVFALIIVSSDDMDILEHAYSYFSVGTVQPHKRPSTLCGDTVPIKTVVRYCIQSYIAREDVCLLQATNPLITAQQIKDAFRTYKNSGKPYLMAFDGDKDLGFHFMHRDHFLNDYEQLWDMKELDVTRYQLPGVDIDTEADWNEAERRMNETTHNGR